MYIEKAEVTVYCDQGILFDKTMMKSDLTTDDGFGALVQFLPDLSWQLFGPLYKPMGRTTGDFHQAGIQLRPQKDGSCVYSLDGCIPIGTTFVPTGESYKFEWPEGKYLEVIAYGPDYYIALGPLRDQGQALVLVPKALNARTSTIDNSPNRRPQEESIFSKGFKAFPRSNRR